MGIKISLDKSSLKMILAGVLFNQQLTGKTMENLDEIVNIIFEDLKEESDEE